MKTILTAVDLSPISPQVLKAAAALAKPLGAEITLLHVVTPVSSCVPVGSAMDVAAIPIPLTKEEFGEIKKHLEQLAAPFQEQGIVIHCIVKEALPMDEINHQVLSHHADILVVGSHGHGGLYHLFNGSVVTALLKTAVKPILVVPVKA